MSKKKYYGVYGRNGGGIYNDWHHVMKSRPYIHGGKEKGFPDKKRAVEFVIQGLVDDYRLCQRYEVCESLLYERDNYFWPLTNLRMTDFGSEFNALPFVVRL